jgi:phosphoserine phosphatase RsbU/P
MSGPEPGHLPPESFADFLTEARTGYLYTNTEGRIIYANPRAAGWLQSSLEALVGTKLSDHFPIARRVYYETHLAPLLRMQGFFDEVAFDLRSSDGTLVPVFLSAVERHDDSAKARFVCFTVSPALERRIYERNLVTAKNVAASDNSRLLGELAEHARARLTVEEHLSSAQQAAALREQFIAVLGHDLRNPLAAIEGAMRLIAKTPLNERATTIIGMVHQSVARMAELIDNVMDFARGRLGSGLAVTLKNTDLTPVLEHVIRELEVASPNRSILRGFDIPGTLYCDGKRIAQLLSNLLANALVHGAADGPVLVIARSVGDAFTLEVANSGAAIPQDAMDRLFEPFTREDTKASQQGLGLGLYIASEIARAHGGQLSVQSTDEETRFTLRIPLSPAK